MKEITKAPTKCLVEEMLPYTSVLVEAQQGVEVVAALIPDNYVAIDVAAKLVLSRSFMPNQKLETITHNAPVNSLDFLQSNFQLISEGDQEALFMEKPQPSKEQSMLLKGDRIFQHINEKAKYLPQLGSQAPASQAVFQPASQPVLQQPTLQQDDMKQAKRSLDELNPDLGVDCIPVFSPSKLPRINFNMESLCLMKQVILENPVVHEQAPW